LNKLVFMENPIIKGAENGALSHATDVIEGRHHIITCNKLPISM